MHGYVDWTKDPAGEVYVVGGSLHITDVSGDGEDVCDWKSSANYLAAQMRAFYTGPYQLGRWANSREGHINYGGMSLVDFRNGINAAGYNWHKVKDRLKWRYVETNKVPQG